MFIFVTLLPITLYGILLYNKSSEIIQDKVNLSISEALTQISTSINEKIEKVRNDCIFRSLRARCTVNVSNRSGD